MHPESPGRLTALLARLEGAPIEGTTWVAPRPATRAELLAVHSPTLLAELDSLQGRSAQLDPDTGVGEHSVDAAVLAAGAAIGAVEAVLGGAARNAFALLRPPGHHAEPGRAMGFCLLNNAALAAEAARRGGAARVAVLDWDVHHGNGTQAAFYHRSDVLYLSAHQFPFYPGTGAPQEIGEGEGRGFTVNCALPPGQTDADYGVAFHEVLLPTLQAYRPDLVIVSAGFDAHRADPLAGMRVTERGFAAMCSLVRQVADQCCGGKLVLLLEGGYDPAALADSVHACVERLASNAPPEDFPPGDGGRATAALALTRAALAPCWSVL